MTISIVPVSPVNSPVPESGTTEMDRSGVPRVITPRWCSRNVPWRPFNVPLTRSTAT